MKITCSTTCSTSSCLKNKPHFASAVPERRGPVPLALGAPSPWKRVAEPQPAASTRGCGRIPPTSSQSNKSKDAVWEGRVFCTLTTYFTCSPPPLSWPSSVPVGLCGNCSSKTLRNGHRDSQKGVHLHFVEASVWKNSALRTRVREICALCTSAFAVGRHFVTFPVLSLQVQLHQTPAQEHRVGVTSISVPRWLSVLWSRLVALSPN